MDNKLVYLMREINKNIAIESRIYGEFSSKQKYNNIEAPILYSLLIFENVTQNDIVNEYLIPKQSVNNVIKKFEAMNIVVLNIDNNDRRKKIITLTEKGLEYINEQIGPMIERENEAARQLGINKLNDILNSLKELNKTLIEVFNEVE